MSAKKRLLLLATASRPKHLFKIRDLFLSFSDWEVKFVNPDDTHFAVNSVLFIPDTKGLNTTVSYLTGGGIVPNFPPQDTYVEWFRLQNLHRYAQKKIGVFGIGASAFLIFAELLKGKLSYGRDGLWYAGDIHTRAYFEDHPFEGRFRSINSPVCGGDSLYKLDEDLVAYVEELFFPPSEKVLITNPNPVPPIDLDNYLV